MTQDKTLFKMEMVARYMVTHPNATFAEVGELCGMTTSAMANLMSRPEYKRIFARLKSNVLGFIDEELMDKDLINRHYRAKLSNVGVPLAVELMINAMQGRINGLPVSEKAQLFAAREVLDREGTFPKLSRVNAQVEHSGATSTADDDVASDIINKLKNAQQQGQTVDATKFIN